MGGNGRPLISEEKKEMIRKIFNEDPRASLRNAATQVGLHHTTIWNFLKRELELDAYKLKMHQQITDLDKVNRVYLEILSR